MARILRSGAPHYILNKKHPYTERRAVCEIKIRVLRFFFLCVFSSKLTCKMNLARGPREASKKISMFRLPICVFNPRGCTFFLTRPCLRVSSVCRYANKLIGTRTVRLKHWKHSTRPMRKKKRKRRFLKTCA